jgi:hypothetical protein
VIYLVTMVGETNRLPFDLPEGEGELVGGFHTEYSSMKFAMFYLAEYINMTTVSGLATTLFLGGWRAPWPITVWSGANSGWWPVLWFLIKVLLPAVLLHLAARHAAADPLRPADGARLEGPHPVLARLDAARRDHAGVAPQGGSHSAVYAVAGASSCCCCAAVTGSLGQRLQRSTGGWRRRGRRRRRDGDELRRARASRSTPSRPA